ncbi:MAG: DALR domain-containing protein [Burkholderiaceae bacterium]
MNSKHDSAVAFKNALDDDFNTPLAFAEMFKYANLLKKKKSRTCSENLQEDILRGMGEVLGLFNYYSQKDYLQREVMIGKLSTEKIEQIISLRQSAKEQKNFKLADKFREDLEQQGVSLEDGPDGTKWKFQRIKTKK